MVTVARILREPVPDLRAKGVPGELAEVVERLMAKEPGDRPASAADTAALLQAVQRATGRSVTRPVIEGARTAHLPKAAPGSAPEAATSVVTTARGRGRLGGDHHDAARPALPPARLVATRRTGARRRRALGARARPGRRHALVRAVPHPGGRPAADRPRASAVDPAHGSAEPPPWAAAPADRPPPRAPMRRRRGPRRRPPRRCPAAAAGAG